MTNTREPGKLTREELETLARYNSEVARGLRHTTQWRSRMRALQRRFNLETYSSPTVLRVGWDMNEYGDIYTTTNRSSKT